MVKSKHIIAAGDAKRQRLEAFDNLMRTFRRKEPGPWRKSSEKWSCLGAPALHAFRPRRSGILSYWDSSS